jgi:thioredoxin-related protein
MALYCSGIAVAGGEGWSSNFAAAQKEAAESKKDLLIDFTGSDWCGWCIKLNKEVFSQDPFKVGVKDKFVLVELDYPQDKSKLSAETLKQNQELAKKYPVGGYPTLLLVDADGKPFASTGYQEGGPEAYVKHLDELRAKKAARDESFAAATQFSGVEKAKALVAALAAMDLEDRMISNFYGEVIEQIKAADPKDETGFAKAAAVKARLAAIHGELQVCGQKNDHAGALAVIDKALKEGGFDTEETQKMMVTRGMILAKQKKFDEALKAMDEAKAFAPNSEKAAAIDGIKARLEAEKKAAGTDK